MKFHSQPILHFLAVIACVESFTSTTSTSVSKFNAPPKSCFGRIAPCYEPKINDSFGLRSIAEDASAETSESETSESESDVEATTEIVETEEESTVETSESEETVAEEGGESSKNTQTYPEEDISKIAYVVNLSYDTPGYKIREMFNEYGEVQKVFMPKAKRTGKSKGIAFVTMSTEEERDASIENINGIECDGRTIYVDKAKPRSEKVEARQRKAEDPNAKKLYVGNISYETTRDDLIEFFGEYGEVKDVYVPVDRDTGAPRGFAFVTMNAEEAEKAIEDASGVVLQGRTIDVKESLPRGQKAAPRQKPSTSGADEVKLYVGNLSFETDYDTISEVFGEFGELIDLYQPVDRYSGRPRGFAFVTMEKGDAEKAIEGTDGMEVDGRIIRVNEAQPKGFSQRDDWGEDDGDWGEGEE